MKAIEYNFCIRGVKQSGNRLFQPELEIEERKGVSKLIIGTKHIHGNHFDPISNLSRIARKWFRMVA